MVPAAQHLFTLNTKQVQIIKNKISAAILVFHSTAWEVTIIEVNTSEPETDENKINSSARSQTALKVESKVFLLIYLIFSDILRGCCIHLYLFILYLFCIFGDSYVSVTLDNPQIVLVLPLRKMVDTVF